MNWKRVQVLGLTILLSFSLTSAKGAITCTIPSVSAGDGTNVTCVFPQDIRISKNNIKVQRQPFNADNSASAVNVLECHWLDQQTFNCDAQPGYKLIGQVSNRAVVGVPTATRDHEGKYTCEVVPSEPSDIQPCYFHLKEEVNAADVNNRLSLVLDELVELRHVVAKGAQEQKSVGSAVLALVVVCIVAIVVAIVLYVFQQRVRKLLQRGKPSTKQRPTEETGEETVPFLAVTETTALTKSETEDPSKQTPANTKSQENDEADKSKDTKVTSENKPSTSGLPKGEVSPTVPPPIQATTDTARHPLMEVATVTAQNPLKQAASGTARSEPPGQGSLTYHNERKTQAQSHEPPPSQACVDEQTAQRNLPEDNTPNESADTPSKAKTKEKCTLS